MIADEVQIKYVGGPTAILEIGGLRFLTDPTFDEKDSFYDLGTYSLHKLEGPVLSTEEIGKMDYVLLSHDHHLDNLDHTGRKVLGTVKKVFTTKEGASRLGNNSVGITNWDTEEVPAKNGRIITITGTPCRHGPVGGDRGPVTGFYLNYRGESRGGIYITGDTVFYSGVGEVAHRFDAALILVFMGAAIVQKIGPDHLTMTADEAIKLTQLFNRSCIIPLHFDGWEHYSETRSQIEEKFKAAGLLDRLQWPY